MNAAQLLLDEAWELHREGIVGDISRHQATLNDKLIKVIQLLLDERAAVEPIKLACLHFRSDITGHAPHLDTNGFVLDVRCLDCGEKWEKLVSLMDLENV